MQGQKAQQHVTASAILWKVTNLQISEKQVKFQIPLTPRPPKRHHKKDIDWRYVDFSLLKIPQYVEIYMPRVES